MAPSQARLANSPSLEFLLEISTHRLHLGRLELIPSNFSSSHFFGGILDLFVPCIPSYAIRIHGFFMILKNHPITRFFFPSWVCLKISRRNRPLSWTGHQKRVEKNPNRSHIQALKRKRRGCCTASSCSWLKTTMGGCLNHHELIIDDHWNRRRQGFSSTVKVGNTENISQQDSYIPIDW